MNEREQAEQMVRDGLCDACDSISCNMENICDGFQNAVEDLLQEWAKENKEDEAINIADDIKEDKRLFGE
ncbi:hypothetical protein LCGC14_2014090 [marine sediment metagenome]|uniref:Uncharacterized protein n=1 Tax=marine sediment metagenome TaxID=412755 RepID=A0A0F9HWN9_9ZZZZ